MGWNAWRMHREVRWELFVSSLADIERICPRCESWWRHQMETFSMLLTFCAGNSPVTGRKGQWRGALMFFFISAWTNSWANNGDAGALRPHRAHYDVTVMYLARPAGPCITNVFATRRKNFSQWHRSFQRKLLSHWLKFLLHVAITLVIQGPAGHAWAPWGPIKRQTFGWWNFKGIAFNYNVSFWQTFHWNEGL